MNLQKIIWAVDAFDTNRKVQRVASRMLHALVERTHAQIEPIYVLSSGQLSLPEEITASTIHLYQPAAEKALKKTLKRIHGIPLQEPHVIVQKTASQLEAIDLLSTYALAKEVGLIVATSHGRSGVKRMLLGSFAETLLLRSKVPVMVAGPQIHTIHSLDHIIFPTDFGPHSLLVFRKVVEIAKMLNARLTLFHSIPHPIEPIFQSGVYLLGGSWVPVQAYFGKEIDRQTKRAKEWTKWAKTHGVETDYRIHSMGGQVAPQLQDLAKDVKAGCIIMESQSGPISAAIIGSVTRQLIRQASCPVWVLKYPALEQDRLLGPPKQKAA